MKSVLALIIAFFVGAAASGILVAWYEVYVLGPIDPKFHNAPGALFQIKLWLYGVTAFVATMLLVSIRYLVWRAWGSWRMDLDKASFVGIASGIFLLPIPAFFGFGVSAFWVYVICLPVAVGAGCLRLFEGARCEVKGD